MAIVRVTFYDNFREEDTSSVSLSTVEVEGGGVDIEVFATAGTWNFTFGFIPTPGEEDDMREVGPFAWNVGAATLEAAIEAAFAVDHPSWVCNVELVSGVYEVRFGSADIFDHPPNAYSAENINLSGHFSTVWDEHPHDVPTTPDPGCGAGADPEDVPPGEIESTGRRGGSVRMPHPCSGAKLD